MVMWHGVTVNCDACSCLQDIHVFGSLLLPLSLSFVSLALLFLFSFFACCESACCTRCCTVLVVFFHWPFCLSRRESDTVFYVRGHLSDFIGVFFLLLFYFVQIFCHFVCFSSCLSVSPET